MTARNGPEAGPSQGTVQPKILVVDDEESFVLSLNHALSREGYRPLAAYDGPAALEMAVREHPDVILLDLMLPGMHGLEVCRALRAAPIPQPGVIMVTAKDTDLDAVVGLESGADDYVAKPFNLDVLLARVRALLRRRRREAAANGPREKAQAEDSITVGGLTVCPEGYEATYRGVQLDLSPRLFGLLLHLARNVGRVLTRDELLNDVWGYEYAGQTRTVDVHVHWLRELLVAAGGCPETIQTVRGVGYKMTVPADGDRES